MITLKLITNHLTDGSKTYDVALSTLDSDGYGPTVTFNAVDFHAATSLMASLALNVKAHTNETVEGA